MVVFHSQMLMWLAEARVAEGAIQQAEELAGVALTATRDRSEVGFEAWALRLAAEVAMHRVPIDVTRADALYRDAMGRAESCGMRPLVARCHLGLGTLHRRAGNGERAAEHLAAARAMFRDMDLRFWCDRADTEFELLAGGGHASPRAGSVESCDSRHTPAATC